MTHAAIDVDVVRTEGCGIYWFASAIVTNQASRERQDMRPYAKQESGLDAMYSRYGKRPKTTKEKSISLSNSMFCPLPFGWHACVSTSTKRRNEEMRENWRWELQSQGAKCNDPPFLVSKFSCSKLFKTLFDPYTRRWDSFCNDISSADI